ncbi:hypothetical protein NW756_011672 [Fusarium oxysporum]|uniref:Uncharacterized protein n=1 Tax=Fusarium oxysporum TaxID=5507 RepID=A0A2H3SVN0_FUSOX|nr:hypothetical protein NW753_012975 [Fusarium oxysporum]KAJ4064184.1 hypothetical protein NW763_004465 [Fusarium oxysporum]KAJ4078556.1 hypothetical protein NW756_011672 [Fusarium oxysporum]SCO80231.1 uncharacterized protein FRV6_04444 [Fusarium oxysporum]
MFVPIPPPPPPPPRHRHHSHRRGRRGGIIIMYIIFGTMAVGIATAIVVVFGGFTFDGHGSGTTRSSQLHETADIFLGIDVVPPPPSSGSTRLLEKNMTALSRVRRNH